MRKMLAFTLPLLLGLAGRAHAGDSGNAGFSAHSYGGNSATSTATSTSTAASTGAGGSAKTPLPSGGGGFDSPYASGGGGFDVQVGSTAGGVGAAPKPL